MNKIREVCRETPMGAIIKEIWVCRTVFRESDRALSLRVYAAVVMLTNMCNSSGAIGALLGV